MKLRICFLIFTALALSANVAHAQLAVFDGTNYANALNEFTTMKETRDQIITAYNLSFQMSRMPQNFAQRYQSSFSQWTNVSGPNTYGNTAQWNVALNIGGSNQAATAYTNAVIPLGTYPDASLSSQDASTQLAIKNQYATSEIGQATITNSLSTVGSVRSNSQVFALKLANLDADTYSLDPTQQTELAVLGKINTATLLQIHSQQDTNQILAAAVAQQALADKQRLDEQNRLMNQAIYFQQNFPNTIGNVNGGVSNSIHSISLSTTTGVNP